MILMTSTIGIHTHLMVEMILLLTHASGFFSDSRTRPHILCFYRFSHLFHLHVFPRVCALTLPGIRRCISFGLFYHWQSLFFFYHSWFPGLLNPSSVSFFASRDKFCHRWPIPIDSKLNLHSLGATMKAPFSKEPDAPPLRPLLPFLLLLFFGSGCAALQGVNRIHAILGASEQCIATHPSDMCASSPPHGIRCASMPCWNSASAFWVF